MSAKITITDPISPFNEYEVIEFSYKSKPAQYAKKTLLVRLAKFKRIANEGESDYFAYADEPILELFIDDVDKHIMEDLGRGETLCAEAFLANTALASKLINDLTSITTEVTQ